MSSCKERREGKKGFFVLFFHRWTEESFRFSRMSTRWHLRTKKEMEVRERERERERGGEHFLTTREKRER